MSVVYLLTHSLYNLLKKRDWFAVGLLFFKLIMGSVI